MAYEHPGAGALDYLPCRYGQSKLLFRGPQRSLEGTFCAFLGGTETYGKFVERPFPALLESDMGVPMVNLGYQNAGVDLYLNEPVLLEACAQAKVTVIQLPGAQNMTNRYYSVHPRRNDRFLHAAQILQTVYREVDFTDFHFTRHMLKTLKTLSPEKYVLVERELREAWVARMRQLLQQIEGPTVLLWLGNCQAEGTAQDSLGPDPLFLDRHMVEAITPFATELIEVNPSASARAFGTIGMACAEMELPAAAHLPGPMIHAEVAAALEPAIRRCL